MAHPAGPPAVKVGVVLPRRPEHLGEWLADGASFEAAGAALLWVEPDREPGLDPLALTAALAAVTFRSLLVTTVPAGLPAEAVCRTVGTVERLSRGRLRLLTGADPGAGSPAGSGTGAAGPGATGFFRQIPGYPETYEHTRAPEQPERWICAPAPDSRATWRTVLLDTAERGFPAVLVPAHPRLLDILRNPDDPGDRHDLHLAVG